MISYLALVSSNCYGAGTLVQGLLILNCPTYEFERWQGTLLFWAALAIALFVNIFLGRILPQIETFLLLFHILGFFIVLITILALAPKYQTASEVFGTFLNTGGFSTNFLATLVGLVTATNAFPGKRGAKDTSEAH